MNDFLTLGPDGRVADREGKTLEFKRDLSSPTGPLRTIVANAGVEPAVVVDRVKAGKDNEGYNATSGEYVDMLAAGIIDPTKVTRFALQNAASIAGLMITTEAMVAEIPKKEEAAPDMGGMGGMGGMGMM